MYQYQIPLMPNVPEAFLALPQCEIARMEVESIGTVHPGDGRTDAVPSDKPGRVNIIFESVHPISDDDAKGLRQIFHSVWISCQ